MYSSVDITRLLAAWTEGEQQAVDELMPVIYGELRRIARRHWRGQRQGHTLQPTALIHEAFLKLVGQADSGFRNRAHFFAVASIAMRQVLVNHAKAALAAKRGGGKVDLSLAETDAVQAQAREVLDLHEALASLQEMDPRKSRVVELRYFGGLSIEETAEALDISTATVIRDWQAARAWLARELGSRKAGEL